MQERVRKLTNIKGLSNVMCPSVKFFLKKLPNSKNIFNFVPLLVGKYSANGVIIISKQLNK